MKTLVVLFALATVACASWAPVVQYHAPTVYVGGSAVSHQSRVDVHSSPAVVSTYAAPAWGAHSLLGHSAYGLAGHGYGYGHWLKKRSLGHLTYSAPLVVAPSAVSHQSRVDVISKPAVVAHAYAAPVVAHAVAAPVVHALPAAVSHQSRVDVRASYVPYAHGLAYAAAPYAHGLTYAAPFYGAHGLSHGHLLKKRSLAFAHAIPSAVSHQSRVDVISSPAVVAHTAPIAVAHAAPLAVAHVAPAAVSHQSRVDFISEPAHVAYSAAWAAPAHYSSWHSPLAYSSHW